MARTKKARPSVAKRVRDSINTGNPFKETTSRHSVTAEGMGTVKVSLDVLGADRNMGPDQRVFVQVYSRFPADPDGLYQQPHLTMRACELDDLVLGLQAAIQEGRRSFVLPEPEPRERTLSRAAVKRSR